MYRWWCDSLDKIPQVFPFCLWSVPKLKTSTSDCYFLSHDQDKIFAVNGNVAIAELADRNVQKRNVRGRNIWDRDVAKMCISDGNSWERKWGESVQKGCIFRRGKRKSLLPLLHKCFWTPFLSTGKHWMLRCIYCCVDEHLKLDFILSGSRKQKNYRKHTLSK